ncbi:hypothetical protein [Polyangium jinanense]|uniref:Uncharacterized protein n=1 Tax=Polyangium jinanense TaxID=2829994 RepID=A0A9X3XE61_9BACT|nr:hypothetical protein [Polyangium jinanense]MDC3961341.1 hypothetical protein [Polyangium jinanense]MDC3987720.1 hypothetical protein [Polyangium jinanense]
MYEHGTRGAAAAILLISFASQAQPVRDAEVPGAHCFTSLGVRFDAPGAIPGGENPDRIELFLDGKPCIEITPAGRACEMRAPPDAVCDVIAPLSIAEGWCHLAEDGSWSANFQVLSTRLLADDVTHALTAYVATPAGTTVREAPVDVSRYHPRGPNGAASVTCFQGNAAFRGSAAALQKDPNQG